MNLGRLAIAAITATVADMAYGFIVYAMLLGPSFSAFPGVYRPSDDTSHMGYLALGVLIVMFCASFIYTRGYEGGAPASEGLRFGCVLGTFMVGASLINYAILNVGRMLTLKMAAAGFIEWLIMGTIIAVVAKPRVAAKRMATV